MPHDRLALASQAQVVAEQMQRAPWPVQWAWLLLLAAPVVMSVRDLIRHSEEEFRTVGMSKSAWIVLLIAGGPFSAVAYLLIVRPRWKRTQPAA